MLDNSYCHKVPNPNNMLKINFDIIIKIQQYQIDLLPDLCFCSISSLWDLYAVTQGIKNAEKLFTEMGEYYVLKLPAMKVGWSSRRCDFLKTQKKGPYRVQALS